MKWGAKRKWGPSRQQTTEQPRILLGSVVAHHDGRYFVRTTRRGYVFLWAFGYRTPA